MISQLCRDLVMLGCVVVGLIEWFGGGQLLGVGFLNLAGIFYIVNAIEKERK